MFFDCFLDGPGVWFKSLADCEPADTYLKVHGIHVLINLEQSKVIFTLLINGTYSVWSQKKHVSLQKPFTLGSALGEA